MPSIRSAIPMTVVAALAAFVSASPPAFGEELVIGAWNLENLFDEKRDEATPSADVFPPEKLAIKLRNDAQVIKEMNCDILGLVEVENRSILRRLCEEHLTDLGYKYFELIEETDGRGIDCALISKRPFLSRSFTVPGFVRGVLACRFVVKGDPFYVLVNHWKSRLGGGEEQRLACAQRVIDIAKRDIIEYEGRPMPIIVVGDLNDEAHNRSVQKLLEGGFHDVFVGVPDHLRWTIPYDDRRAERVLYQGFDHILVNDGLKDGVGIDWVPGSARVFRAPMLLRQRDIRGKPHEWLVDDYDDFIGYADHLPVLATFRVK